MRPSIVENATWRVTPGLHAGGTGPTTFRSGASPVPSPATTRSCLPFRYAIRQHSLGGSSDQRAPWSSLGRSSAHRVVPSGVSAARRCARVTATCSAFGDQAPSHQGPSSRFDPSGCTIHGPLLELTRSDPPAGSAVSAGFGFDVCSSGVTASRTLPTSARPGGETNAASRTRSARATTRSGRRFRRCHETGSRVSNDARTSAHARRCASISSGAWIRWSERLTSSLTAAPCRRSPRAGRGRGAGAS